MYKKYKFKILSSIQYTKLTNTGQFTNSLSTKATDFAMWMKCESLYLYTVRYMRNTGMGIKLEQLYGIRNIKSDRNFSYFLNSGSFYLPEKILEYRDYPECLLFMLIRTGMYARKVLIPPKRQLLKRRRV